jgi:hypothetical protein
MLLSLYTPQCSSICLSEFFNKKNTSLFQATLISLYSSGKNLWKKITLNHKKPIIIEHLAYISVKHHVYLSELYQALVSARESGKSTCETLTIKYRGIKNDQAIFLITKGSIIIAQFRVEEEFLLRKNISFESWLDTDKIRRQITKQNLRLDSMLIQNLRYGMKKVNLTAEVLEIEKPHLIRTQYGNSVMLTGVWIGDETGKVKLCLWGEQKSFPVVGDIVQIKHSSVRTFRGERLLSLGKFGSFSILRAPIVDNGNLTA